MNDQRSCTPACALGHTARPGCVRAVFFQPGTTYRNAGAFVGRQQVFRFRCLAIEPHPGHGAITAVGWLEIMPGTWIPGGIDASDFFPNLWSEA